MIDSTKTPSLARGCRIGADRTLLMPEGLLKLSETAVRILELCDGKRSLDAVIAELQASYPIDKHAQIRADVLDYVEKLALKKALELR